MQRVIIFLGSSSDAEFATPVRILLDKLGVKSELRIASAHKDSQRLMEMLKQYEELEDTMVYVTVAGMSNALSGFIDFKTRHPVISCPHLEEEFALVDVYSSLRMPAGVAPLVILNPENAALAAAKILGETNPELAKRIREFQENTRLRNEQADKNLQERSREDDA
ncbi:MAG: AIR carboxylase family protein [archaeon]